MESLLEAGSSIMTKGESPDECYHPLSPLQFWKENDLRTRGAVLSAWLLTLVVSVGLGIASIALKWSGIPMHFGGVDVSVTIYPTLIFCMLWVVWFGFWWGFIPAYLSTLILALYSGMPVGWAFVFAFSDPIGLAIFAIVYRALPVPLNLRSLNSSALFVFISFVSGMFGSSGAFIWCLAQGSLSALLPIWQGWWLGAFLQNIVLVAPVIHLGTRRVMRWRNDYGLMGQHTTQTQRQILLMTIIALTGVLLYLYVAIRLVSKQIESALHGSDPISLRNAASLQVESMSEIFWIISILIAFIAFFGYQLFVLWIERKQVEYELILQNSGLEAITASLEKSLAERRKAEEALHLQAVELEDEVAERQVAQDNLREKALLLEEEIEKRQEAQEELERLNEGLELRVQERTSEVVAKSDELEQKNRELERFNKLFVGRELKMVELKERIRELEGDRKEK
jgi:hypothetical protein